MAVHTTDKKLPAGLLLMCIAAFAAVLALLLVLRGIAAGKKTESKTETAPQDTSQAEEAPASFSFDRDALSAGIKAICPDGSGDWDICIEDLSGEDRLRLLIGSDGSGMVSASLIKLYIMGAVYDDINAGRIDHDTAYPLIYDMITVSDNDAANELIAMLGNGSSEDGMAKVNSFAAASGCTDTVMNRLMLVEDGTQNYTTSLDCAVLLRQIYAGECVSAEYSLEMLSILKAQTRNTKIPAELPDGTVCAHKTGELLELCTADAGIVFSGSGDYIICMICCNFDDFYSASQRIADISSLVYNAYTQNR